MMGTTTRSIGAVLPLVLASVLAGCATARAPAPAIPAYAGATRPADRVAIFNCGFGVTLRAIDGDRSHNGSPLACRYSVLPGRHRFRVSFSAEKGNGAESVSSRHDYIVRLDLAAGHQYTLNAFRKSAGTSAMPWKVELADSARKYPSRVTDVHAAH